MKVKTCILSSSDQAALATWLSKHELKKGAVEKQSAAGMHWGFAGWCLALAAGAAFKGALWRAAGKKERAHALEIAVLDRLVKKAAEKKDKGIVGHLVPAQQREAESLGQYEAAARLWSIARAQRAVGMLRAGGFDEQCQEFEGAIGALIGQLLREDWEVAMGAACRAVKWGRVSASFAPQKGLPELSRVAHDALVLRMEIEELPESLQESFCALQKLEVSWVPAAMAPKESSSSRRL